MHQSSNESSGAEAQMRSFDRVQKNDRGCCRTRSNRPESQLERYLRGNQACETRFLECCTLNELTQQTCLTVLQQSRPFV